MMTHTTPLAVTILGLSKSGLAVAEYVIAHGGRCFLSELSPASPANEDYQRQLSAFAERTSSPEQLAWELGGHSKSVFTFSDLIVTSPGIPPTSPVMEQLQASGKEVISEVEFAYRQNKMTRQLPMVGITGTNGKTTTTTLISEILTHANHIAPSCGNIGTPVISCIDNPDNDYLVVELSSFQLAFSPTLTADIAVFLNLRPDHLNWHGSLASYQRANMRLFTAHPSPKWIVLHAEDPVSQEIAANTTSQILWFSLSQDTVKDRTNRIFMEDSGQVVIETTESPPTTLLDTSRIKLRGRHNLENILAAAATAFLLEMPVEKIQAACTAFTGVEHRLELVTTFSKADKIVPIYNDSKATNTDAAISALNAFEKEPLVLIAGGRDKMEDLTEFSERVKAIACHVVLLGEAQQRFSEALSAVGYTGISVADSLEVAVQKAMDIALSSPNGCPILFSPACASFDMYPNFEIRGQAFKQYVSAYSNETTGLKGVL
ncbi:MAG: UDP-N-acetylmuramoyl-L-alanine--D-glutamate ligase [Vampirovibrio sp.]|nr:UDP-N-acetylmuramoyl-L-alanine--D-glutamate ligase [Vampirovibrio sp.]